MLVIFNSCTNDYLKYPKSEEKILRLSKNQVLLPRNSYANIDIVSGVGGYSVESKDNTKVTVKLVGKKIKITPFEVGKVEVVVTDKETLNESKIKVEVKSINFKEKVYVRGGTYMYANKKIEIKDFYIDKNEVTNEKYCEYLNKENIPKGDLGKISDGIVYKIKDGKNNYTPKEGYENYPVVERTWHHANDYAKAMGGRLPSITEWEYAAQGGVLGVGHGDEEMTKKFKDEHAWYMGNVTDQAPKEVLTKKPNALKIYDMIGNVAEWVQDDPRKVALAPIDGKPYENPNGIGEKKVLKGGSYSNTSPYFVHGSIRKTTYIYTLFWSGRMFGFRVVYDEK